MKQKSYPHNRMYPRPGRAGMNTSQWRARKARAEQALHRRGRRQRGVTLIEAIIFLSLLSVVLGIVLNKASIAFASNRAAQSTDAAQLIAAGIKSAYQLRNSYAGLNTTAAINNGLVPDYMVSGGTLTNVWGGGVVIEAVTTPSNGFTIVFRGVPAEDCAKFVNAVSSGFEEVSIKNTKVKTFGSQGGANPARVGAECSKPGVPDIKLFGI